MQTFLSTDSVPGDYGPSAVTIGKFDGVHAGHRRVIGQLLDVARHRELVSTVLTFDRNPLSLLRPEACPEPLTSNFTKLELLASTGLDATIMLTFDRALSELSAEAFVRSIVVGSLHARAVVIGRDSRFGAGRVGTVPLLIDLGKRYGFDVIEIDDLAAVENRRVSSTWIRELLDEGRVGEAAELLGSLPRISSVVIHGRKRGRTLGYPTANLDPRIDGKVPADGVYAAWFSVDGATYPAAVSVGNNPTFEGVAQKQVEAYLIDESFDLYGKSVEISFVQFVRGMRKFDGTGPLVEQMAADVVQVRRELGAGRGLRRPIQPGG